jgi:predicted glycoside hydrolase/deacetylase ChbG (UPF0249 family)
MNKSLAPTAKGVVVCADDFGFNASVSLGIADLATMERISAASVMTLSDRWPQDVTLLQPLRQRIDVGLHLDWTSDFAMAAGHGMSLGQAMRRAVLRGFDIAQASSVIEQQLDLFESHWQAPPDFVDGHQHVQQFDGIRQALVAVLARRYAGHAQRPYLRISRPPRGSMDVKSQVIAAMGANALESIAFSAGLTSVATLLGTNNFKGDIGHYGTLMARWLAQAPPGSILMCHPALAAQPEDAIGAARLKEFTYLRSPEFALALSRAQVSLIRGVSTGSPLKSTRD